MIALDVKKSLSKYYKSAEAIGQIRLGADYRNEVLTPFVVAKNAPSVLLMMARTIETPPIDLRPSIERSMEMLGTRTHPIELYLLNEMAAWNDLIESLKTLRSVIEGLTQKKVSEYSFEAIPAGAKKSVKMLCEQSKRFIDELKQIIALELKYLPLTDRQLEQHIRLLESKTDDQLHHEAETLLAGVRG